MGNGGKSIQEEYNHNKGLSQNMFNITNRNNLWQLADVVDCFDNINIELSGELKDNFDDLILSDLWPNEVPTSLIAKTDDQIAIRAKSIACSYGFHNILENGKFLDFGCGKGNVVIEAAKIGVESYGYDPIEQWPNYFSNIYTDIDTIKSIGPFSIIGMYDVIDHIETYEETLETMSIIGQLSDKNTIIKVRCHPWTSRHGGHLYETINRAYAHILMSSDELKKHCIEKTREIKRPLAEYQKIFKNSGFKILSLNKIQTPLEPIFKSPQFVSIFQKILGGDQKWQEDVLSISFVDYVLRLK